MSSEDLLVERLIRRVEQANLYFLKKIGSSIARLKQLRPSEAQQLVQILKYGSNYEDIIDQISKYTNLNIQDIDEIFTKYAEKDRLFYEKFYRYRNISFKESLALQTQRNALTEVVKNEMYNFTRTNVLGYTINGTFHNLKDTYNQLLDVALLNVGQGKETFDSALFRILKDIGSSGLKTLEYESGRSIRLDSAIRMHLKGRLRELHNENQKIIGDEIGADGVEISVHENPAKDHEAVQGHQLYNEQFDLLQKTGKAIDVNGVEINIHLQNKQGEEYKTHRPISEMNCYHYVFSIIVGVSEPEYSDKELQKIIDDNNKGFELDGKHYTNYEGTQLQRRLETEIRKQKDTQILARSSDTKELISQSQSKITALTNKYNELSQVSGLPTKMDRLRVSGYRKQKINEIKSIGKNFKIKNKSYQDLTENLRKMNGNIEIKERRLNYSIDINKNKYENCYFEPDKKLVEERKYQQLIEKKTGYETYLIPKPKQENIRTPDYWIKDIDELWDLKGLDGNKENF